MNVETNMSVPSNALPWRRRRHPWQKPEEDSTVSGWKYLQIRQKPFNITSKMPPPRKAPGVGQKIGREPQHMRTNKSRTTKKFNVLAEDGERRLGTADAVMTSRRESHTAALALESFEMKSIQQHPLNVLKGFEVMWRQNLLCDVTITFGSHRMRAHKALLATCADYFRNLFSNTPDEPHGANTEVCLEGISVSTAEALIESMYTGKIQVSEGNVRELLAAASSLKYYTIEEACDEFLRRRLNKSNCLRMLNLAFMYVLNDLTDEALRLSALHFTELSGGFDFHQTDNDQLTAIISRDDIKADSELEIFRSVLSWIEFDKKNRLQYAASLLREIRLPLLSPSDIVDHVETVEYLMLNHECQKFVKEALHYHCLPARQTLLQSPRTCPRLPKVEAILTIGGAPRLKSDPVSRDVSYLQPEKPETTWSVLTNLKEPRHHHAVAVLNGFLYVAGGEETNDQRSPLNTSFRYNPRSNQWLQIASMKKRRESFQLGVLNGMLYAVGGRVDQDVSLADVERYNPSVDEWEMVAPLSSPRRSVAVAAHNGRLYAMGGSGHKRISSRNERYNPLTDQWEARRSLTVPRFFSMLAAVGNKLYLQGGATLDQLGSVVCAKKVECYVPLTDTWMVLTGMNEPRAEAGCAVLGGKIYVVGGYSWDDNKRLNSTEVYDTQTDTWSYDTPIRAALTGIGCCAMTVYNPTSKTDSNQDQEPAGQQGEEGEGEEEEEEEEPGDGLLNREEIGSLTGEDMQLQAPNGN